jgi:hypothetical protein
LEAKEEVTSHVEIDGVVHLVLLVVICEAIVDYVGVSVDLKEVLV